MNLFLLCSEINNLIETGDDLAARNMLIKLLHDLSQKKMPYPEVVNQFIRSFGLFPYLQLENTSWDQRFIYEAFSVDVGNKTATLHREQSTVLSKLLNGKNIALSAPTSFGKSFIIDAYIAAKQPDTVVIIVPTIALMDETRRRLYKKFSYKYNIITTPDTELGYKNILIFPQERAFGYIHCLRHIDLLVVDEFYKASEYYDKERSPSLIKAIIKLSQKSKQRYYLAPNIKNIKNNIFTSDMEFIELLNFNTVFLEKHESYKDIENNYQKKSECLLSILSSNDKKSLIYAGTFSEIKKVSDLLISRLDKVSHDYTVLFANWLRENYQKEWAMADLAERGIGIHHGRMHRCLSQIQIKLFEEENGFYGIISTSSIIEGVNTSAENVVLWNNKIGQRNLKEFTYKNIIGRAGRMFKHFVGHIYLLSPPPREEERDLDITLPDSVLGGLDESEDCTRLTDKQIEKIIEYKKKMSDIIGTENFLYLKKNNLLMDSDSNFLFELANNMKNNPSKWRGLGYLNAQHPDNWDYMLYEILKLKNRGWGGTYTEMIKITKALSKNWSDEIPEILLELKPENIDIEKFFLLERSITFKLSALLNDVNELHKIIINPHIDISNFISRVSHAFLPPLVYHLEEYGLPRMISRKLHKENFMNFESRSINFRDALNILRNKGEKEVLKIKSLSDFDIFIINNFLEGIS